MLMSLSNNLKKYDQHATNNIREIRRKNNNLIFLTHKAKKNTEYITITTI